MADDDKPTVKTMLQVALLMVLVALLTWAGISALQASSTFDSIDKRVTGQ